MIAAPIFILAAVYTATGDGFSFPSFFSANWAQIGGWSLFIGLCLLIVVGAFREWWVPGPRHRRVESAAAEQSKTLSTTVDLLKEQTQANEITKYFFETTVPKRGEPKE